MILFYGNYPSFERQMPSSHPLDALVGWQLSSVEFVQDYLQLHFDDKTITFYIWPAVLVGDKEY